jgi:protease-4
VLLRVNSPGGTIGASQELYEAVKRVREGGKKVVVSVGDLCASGAYYASLPADRIIANPGSLVGSIGVILSAPEITGLMDKIGLRMNTVKSAPSKDILSPYRAMTGGERASLQELIDGMYGQFLDAVLTWRTNRAAGGSAAVMKRHADGRVFTGAQALKLGFIDGLGDERAARRELAALCGMRPESATVRRLGGGKWQDLLELSGLFPGRGLTGAHLEYRVQGL